MYAIAHCGSTVQLDAIGLAKAAKLDGADAIASVPPYYERSVAVLLSCLFSSSHRPSTVAALIAWLQPIAAAVPDLPMFYYHIPGTTYVNIQIFDLLTEAQTALPQLCVMYMSLSFS
jgi:N-acetylneuraminate lyase